ncbi:MAG TPA: hypothetical protein VKY26_12965, partial [Actinomycetota bacterium]|nr:hypothetical protein [Actinomycetota bacterium]
MLASETVTNLARKIEGLTYKDRGTAQLKGFAEPVQVYTVLPENADAEPEGAAEPLQVDTARTAEQTLPIGGFLGSLP